MDIARPSKSCSGSGYISSQGRKSKWCDKATEFLCSACLLCVACPLAVVWCCIKVPCKAGWHAVQHARQCACGSGRRVYASYSSFSDIDLDAVYPGKAHRDSTSSKTLEAPCPWQRKRSAMQNTKL